MSRVHNQPSIDDAGLVTIDVERLVYSKLLAVANSGGGKGWFLRRLLEQTHGSVQHVVFDPEGELHTLRERFEYVLIGRGGEAAATVKNARRLARHLLKTQWSAIIDLSDLPVTKEADQRAEFVREFLEGLMEAPRDLWREVLVVLDEAQLFCPEKGVRESASTSAVIDLMTRGRKRGFCGVLATQRISELHKSAAAECNNRLIGRTSLDVDQARAAKALGMRADRELAFRLRTLGDGEFYAWGPAFGAGAAREVVAVKVGTTTTTHERAKARQSRAPLNASALKSILAELADLDREADAETSEVERLRARVKELEGKVSDAPTSDEFKVALDNEREHVKALEEIIEYLTNELDAIADRAIAARNKVGDELEAEAEVRTVQIGGAGGAFPITPANDRDPDPSPTPSSPSTLTKMERAFLTVLAQRHPYPLSKAKILLFAGYAAGGATSRTFAKLNQNGWMVLAAPGVFRISNKGLMELGQYEPLPRGSALRRRISSELDTMTRKIFETVCGQYPRGIGKGEVLHMTGYAAGGATSRAFAHLVARDYLVAEGPGRLVANKDLFEA